jgi:Tfp pilus assembly protein PilO
MSSLKKTKILGALVLLLILAGSWFLLLSPRLGEPAILQQQADDALSQSATLSAQVSLLKQQEEGLPAAEQAASEVAQRFPSNSDVPFLIEQIEGAASRSGMARDQILSVIPSKPRLLDEAPPPPPPAETPADGESSEGGGATPPPPPAAPMSSARMDVQISAKGSFTQVTGFLTQLQTSERVIIVDRVRLSRLVDSTPTGQTNPDGTPIQQAPSEPIYQAEITTHIILLPPLMTIDGSIPESQVEIPANTVIIDEGFDNLDPNLNFDPDVDPNQLVPEPPVEEIVINEPPDPNQPQIVDPNQPQIVDPNQPQIVDPNQPQIVDPNQPQIVDPNQPQIVDPNQPVSPTQPPSPAPTTLPPGVIDNAPIVQQ